MTDDEWLEDSYRRLFEEAIGPRQDAERFGKMASALSLVRSLLLIVEEEATELGQTEVLQMVVDLGWLPSPCQICGDLYGH